MKFNINILVMMLLSAIIGLYTWKAYLHQGKDPPSQLPWVPIDANKPRSFVNKTSDAGMYIERTRRIAIISNPNPVYGYKGSTNGSLEWNFLTSVCVCPSRKVCPFHSEVDDGGNATSNICDYIDGNGDDILDSGGADPNSCDPPKSGCQTLEIDDGGNATAAFCDYLDGNGQDIFDGGKADVNLCDL